MIPIVHVLYETPTGQVRFEERGAHNGMDSIDPTDFDLNADDRILVVFFKMQALEVYVRGERHA